MALTERAFRVRNPGFFSRTRLWWNAKFAQPAPPTAIKRAIDSAPVVMVAVDTTHSDDERHPAIQRETRHVLSLSDEFRVVCVSVVGAPALGASGDDGASALHVEHLARLRAWTAPLGLSAQRLSLHVIVAPDPARALVDFARRNHVDVIILGAPRPRQQPLAWMRSVASGVTANAHCSVHVVRVPEPKQEEVTRPTDELSPFGGLLGI